MRALVTLITATAFVLHFALGCCTHHAHAEEGAPCTNHAKVAAHGHNHDAHGHNHDGHGHESPGPCDQSPGDSDSEFPGQHCNDGHCVFLAAAKTLVSQDMLAVAIPFVVAEPASPFSISPLAAAAIDSGGLIAPPVRTHLFNQVLLI